MVTAPSFWRGKRVFVTGHTGFKGAWLALWLTDLGAEVTGYSLPPPTDPSLFDMAGVKSRLRHLDGDVRDEAGLGPALAVCEARAFKVVFHGMGRPIACSGFPTTQPAAATYATNVMGTVNLLEAVRRWDNWRAGRGLRAPATSAYENRETPRPYREDDAVGGYAIPTAAARGCAELVASRVSTSHSSAAQGDAAGRVAMLATARAGNVIGGGGLGEGIRLILDLLNGFATGVRPLVRFPSAVRPWQRMCSEPLAGYLRLARALWTGDPARGRRMELRAR